MCKFQKIEKSNHHFPELNGKKSFWQLARGFFSPSKISVLIIILVIGVGFTYLIQTNISATQGYKIKELEKQINELKENSKKLTSQYAELQSIDNIASQVADLNLVKSEEVEVITALGSVVALR